MLDILVKGGHVVGLDHEGTMDVGIRGETIAFVSQPGTVDEEALVEIDASGKIVVPGGVEGHAHIHEPMYRGWTGGKEVWLQSPEGATRAAVFGGTTTVLSFAFMDVHIGGGQAVFDASVAVADRTRAFDGRSFADFAFHPVLTGHISAETIAGLAGVIESGTPSFKLFTTDVTSGQDGIRIDTGSTRAVFRELAAHGGIAMVHAEDDDLIKYMEAKLAAEGANQLTNMHEAHTDLGEALAFDAVASVARDVGSAVYFVHIKTARSAAVVARERATGRAVYGETLHNLLCWSRDLYHQPDGAKYHIGMGLGSSEDQIALWSHLRDGAISTVATDEYTTSLAVKMGGHNLIQTTPGGHVGIETRGPIMFSEGYGKDRMSLRRFVDVFSTNPARIWGLFPKKGLIAPGSDADIAIFDPSVRKTITMDDLHHDGDYSAWEGWDVEGWPVTTILRGKVVVDGGDLHGDPSDGQWLARHIDPEVLRGPTVI